MLMDLFFRHKNQMFTYALTAFLFSILLVPQTLISQEKVEDQAWVNHLVKGDAKKLSAFLGTAISIELPSQSGSFSKNQAVMMLTEFFSIYPAEKVVIKQSGNTGSTGMFYIGEYHCRTTEYRLYVLTNNSSGSYLIHSLSITKK
jgi:hypothetical protein